MEHRHELQEDQSDRSILAGLFKPFEGVVFPAEAHFAATELLARATPSQTPVT
jgi:hypothetical protein